MGYEVFNVTSSQSRDSQEKRLREMFQRQIDGKLIAQINNIDKTLTSVMVTFDVVR